MLARLARSSRLASHSATRASVRFVDKTAKLEASKKSNNIFVAAKHQIRFQSSDPHSVSPPLNEHAEVQPETRADEGAPDAVIGSDQLAELPLLVEATPQTVSILAESSKVIPLVWVFYIPGDQQCMSLVERLSVLANQHVGKFRIAFIDTSRETDIVNAFRITNAPTTLAVFQGKPVFRFVGNVSETMLNDYVSKLLKAGSTDAVQSIVSQAEAFLAQNNIPEAAKLYSALLQDESLGQVALGMAGLIQCAIKEGNMDGARELAERIKTDYPMEQHAPAIKAALSLIELAESNTGSDSIETLQQQIKDDPENMEARFSLATKLFASGKTEESIETLLGMIKKNKMWNEQAARKQLVKIFESLGPDNDLAHAGRKRLSALWFL